MPPLQGQQQRQQQPQPLKQWAQEGCPRMAVQVSAWGSARRWQQGLVGVCPTPPWRASPPLPLILSRRMLGVPLELPLLLLLLLLQLLLLVPLPWALRWGVRA